MVNAIITKNYSVCGIKARHVADQPPRTCSVLDI